MPPFHNARRESNAEDRDRDVASLRSTDGTKDVERMRESPHSKDARLIGSTVWSTDPVEITFGQELARDLFDDALDGEYSEWENDEQRFERLAEHAVRAAMALCVALETLSPKNPASEAGSEDS